MRTTCRDTHFQRFGKVTQLISFGVVYKRSEGAIFPFHRVKSLTNKFCWSYVVPVYLINRIQARTGLQWVSSGKQRSFSKHLFKNKFQVVCIFYFNNQQRLFIHQYRFDYGRSRSQQDVCQNYERLCYTRLLVSSAIHVFTWENDI